MHLEVSFKNLRPRDEIRQRGEHLYKKLSRFLDAASEGQLNVGIDHGKAVCELVVSAHGKMYSSTEEDDDLRTALDKLFHTMEGQLRRGKERRGERRRGLPGKSDGFEVEGSAAD